MRRILNGRVLTIVAVVGGLIALVLWPSSIPVDVAAVSRGPLVVTVNEEGRTRVRERYVVSAPVTGRVQRIELEPGDAVRKGDVVAVVRAETAALLDARARAEAEAAVAAAQAAVGRARADEERLRTALTQAQRELARTRTLVGGGALAPQELERREDDVKTAREAVAAASFSVRAAQSDLQRAEAHLASPRPDAPAGRVVTVAAPIAGTVLRRLRESESIVPAGEPLLEIGNPADLEVVADLLSTDAVRVRSGTRAIVERWGGEQQLDARVRRVEPAGFTKISALGVEEQRVNVVLDFLDAADAWKALGDAYRVEVAIVLWEARDVLRVPTAALFREGNDWAVYTIEGNRARRAALTLGHQTAQAAEVTSGLQEGQRVVVHPPDTLADGARIQVDEESSR